VIDDVGRGIGVEEMDGHLFNPKRERGYWPINPPWYRYS